MGTLTTFQCIYQFTKYKMLNKTERLMYVSNWKHIKLEIDILLKHSNWNLNVTLASKSTSLPLCLKVFIDLFRISFYSWSWPETAGTVSGFPWCRSAGHRAAGVSGVSGVSGAVWRRSEGRSRRGWWTESRGTEPGSGESERWFESESILHSERIHWLTVKPKLHPMCCISCE